MEAKYDFVRKYREQILGFESEVGLPQESHHHHVEGIGTGASNGGDGEATPHHNHHAHHHHHHHHPYPHADHPLGPRSMKKKAG